MANGNMIKIATKIFRTTEKYSKLRFMPSPDFE